MQGRKLDLYDKKDCNFYTLMSFRNTRREKRPDQWLRTLLTTLKEKKLEKRLGKTREIRDKKRMKI
jgi:hypothetical protein